MALNEADRATLLDNQFAYDGSSAGAEYARHLPCDTGIFLGEPADIAKALDHLRECADSNSPVHTWRGEPPWPKGTPEQERKKREWLGRIDEHPGTTDDDYSAAVSMLVDPLLPVDPKSSGRLCAAGFVTVRDDGTCSAVNLW